MCLDFTFFSYPIYVSCQPVLILAEISFLGESKPFPVNQNNDIKAMSITRDAVGEDRPPGDEVGKTGLLETR